VLLVGGCGGSGPIETDETRTSTAPIAQVLELGKDDVALRAGEVASPVGFTPGVTFTVGTGWTSVHRYADAFDVGKADPAADRPLVLVTFSAPAEKDAAGALDTIAATQATGDVHQGNGTLLGGPAARLDVVGGSGPAYTSRDAGISLDAGPHQRLRFLATDTPDGVLVVGVLVADGPWGAAGLAAADAVVASLRATT